MAVEFFNRKRIDVIGSLPRLSSIKDENGEIQFYMGPGRRYTQRKAWKRNCRKPKKLPKRLIKPRAISGKDEP
jgi:predicted Abi (CAAX) family protease